MSRKDFTVQLRTLARAQRVLLIAVTLLVVGLTGLTLIFAQRSGDLDAQLSRAAADWSSLRSDLADQSNALARANDRLIRAGEKPVPEPPAGPSGPAGVQGVPGLPGPAPTASQVGVAVARYCAGSGACDGQDPTASQVATAVSRYCNNRGKCKGPTGSTGLTGITGATGPPPSGDQVAAAVADYCSDGRCQGKDGQDGAQGEPGRSAYPFTFAFTVQNNPAESTTYTVRCTPDGCTVTQSADTP